MRFFLTRLLCLLFLDLIGQPSSFKESFSELDTNRTWIFNNCLNGKLELNLKGYVFRDGLKVTTDKEYIIYPKGIEYYELSDYLRTVGTLPSSANEIDLVVFSTTCQVKIELLENNHPLNEWDLIIQFQEGICNTNIYIPNVTKDIFKPYCSGPYKMSIYNRWGSLIYNGLEWDTSYFQEGVYVYVIVHNGISYSGSITVVK